MLTLRRAAAAGSGTGDISRKFFLAVWSVRDSEQTAGSKSCGASCLHGMKNNDKYLKSENFSKNHSHAEEIKDGCSRTENRSGLGLGTMKTVLCLGL